MGIIYTLKVAQVDKIYTIKSSLGGQNMIWLWKNYFSRIVPVSLPTHCFLAKFNSIYPQVLQNRNVFLRTSNFRNSLSCQSVESVTRFRRHNNYFQKIVLLKCASIVEQIMRAVNCHFAFGKLFTYRRKMQWKSVIWKLIRAIKF